MENAIMHQDLYSLSGVTSYCEISSSLQPWPASKLCPKVGPTWVWCSRSPCRAFWLSMVTRHHMETFSALLALGGGGGGGGGGGDSPVICEFPARPLTPSFEFFFDLRLNKRLSNKQSWGWWFETPSRSLWRHGNEAYWYTLWRSWG